MKLFLREVLHQASQKGFVVPSLRDYHYRVQKLNDDILKQLLQESSQTFFSTEDNQMQHYVSDSTCFGYGEKYQLKWLRETVIKTVGDYSKYST